MKFRSMNDLPENTGNNESDGVVIFDADLYHFCTGMYDFSESKWILDDERYHINAICWGEIPNPEKSKIEGFSPIYI